MNLKVNTTLRNVWNKKNIRVLSLALFLSLLTQNVFALEIQFEFEKGFGWNLEAPSQLKVMRVSPQEIFKVLDKKTFVGKSSIIVDLDQRTLSEFVLTGRLFYCSKTQSKVCKVKTIKDQRLEAPLTKLVLK